MQFRPCLDEAPLTTRERSREQFHGLDAEDSDLVLLVGVNVRQVMWPADLREHAHDDPKKP